MEPRTYANALLALILNHLSVDPGDDASRELDDNNEFFLTLEDRLAFMFYFDEDINTFILNVPIGLLPSTAARELVMEELLFGNYSWNLTDGGTLGVDRATGMITVGYLLPLPLAQDEQIIRIVEKLAAVAKHWMRALAEMADGSAAEIDGSMGDAPMRV
jgi:hypothetical protein